MNHFIKGKEYIEIMRQAQYFSQDPGIGHKKLVELFNRAHGTFYLKNGFLEFEPDYYAWTKYSKVGSSLLRVNDDDGKRSDHNLDLRNAMDDEFDVVKRMIKRFNNAFKDWERGDEWRAFWAEKYIFHLKIYDHMDKYYFSKRTYYMYKHCSEHVIKTEFHILPHKIVNPLQHLYDKALDEYNQWMQDEGLPPLVIEN